MTEFINCPGNARTLSSLLSDEIVTNEREVSNYVNDWQPDDIKRIKQILEKENEAITNAADLSKQSDSVKGEEAMRQVYPDTGSKKATDVITLKSQTGTLSLIEVKYLMKFACKGPFGGCGSFKERISGKFLDMECQMIPDEESIDPLRVLVVSEEQFPFSVNHIRSLMAEDYPPGTFSDDGKTHTYVLCSSCNLRTVLDNPCRVNTDVNNYLFFTI